MSGQQFQQRRDTRANVEAATPAQGEAFFVTDKNEGGFGDGATAGGQLHQRKNQSESLAPAQIVADTNNYAPTSYTRHTGALVLTTDAKRRITGLTGGSTDRVLFVINGGAQQMVLSDADTNSTAANRFDLGGDVNLLPKGGIKLFYNATAARWQRTSGGAKFSTIPEEFLLTGVIVPAQITANQNDYAPVDGVTATKTTALASILRLNSDASRNITGIVDPRDGAIKTILNVGSFPIVLQNANTGSSAANRFDFGADITLGAKQSATIRYDGTDSRWKLEAQTAGSAVGTGAVTAQTLAGSAAGGFVGMINGTIVESHAGSAATFAIKTLAGTDATANDPVLAVFQTGTGGYVERSITAALSFTISSGSSMGVPGNNISFRLWLLLIDSGAGVVLGAVNCVSGNSILTLLPSMICSAFAEGGAGAADNAQTIYAAATQGSKFFCYAGYADYDSGLAAAGTWAASPTRIALYGPGVPRPGELTGNFQRSSTGALATGTTVLPYDDTIPQNTEGDQYLSVAIGPTAAPNLVRVRAKLTLSTSAAANTVVTTALFRDATANALAAVYVSNPLATYGLNSQVHFVAPFGAAASTTFKIRAGAHNSGTTTVNGDSGVRKFGGVLDSYIEAEELMG